jgi:GTP pyrophosphokinase
MEEFHYGIASKSVKTSLYLLKKLYPEAFSQTERSAKTRSRSGKAFEPQVLVEGVGSIETKFAKCCNPIKGEPIIAYITKKSELKIHSVDCPYLKSVELDRSNFKKAEWMIGTDSLQLVRLRIYSDSYSKALSVTADTAEDEKIKIISTLKFETRTNEEGLLIEAEVKDINQLERFIGKLKISPAVRSVQNV